MHLDFQKLLEDLSGHPELSIRRKAAAALCKQPKEDCIPTFIQGLSDHEDVAIFCILGLVEMGEKASAEIQKELNSVNESARSYCVEILGEINEKNALDLLLKLIKNDKSSKIRLNAIEAVGKLTADAPEETMQSLIEDPDPEICAAACLAYYHNGIKNTRLIPILLERFLKTPDQNGRNSLIWTMTEISETTSIKEIEKKIHQTEDAVIKKQLKTLLNNITRC